MRECNYDKFPATDIDGKLWKDWTDIRSELKKAIGNRKRIVIVIECYQGVYHEELKEELQKLQPDLWLDTQTVFKSNAEIVKMTYPYITDDRLFGYRAHFSYQDFMDSNKLNDAQRKVKATSGTTIVYGHGATLVAPDANIYVYADMPRWEIQLRSRRHEINGLGVENKEEGASYHYKRGYFVDWIVCDNLKKTLLPKADYWLDTTLCHHPKMITGAVLRKGLDKIAHKPFRVVPFFDPAPWGGQWMKSVCGLNPEQSNYDLPVLQNFNMNKVFESLKGASERRMLANSFLVEAVKG